MVTRIAQGLAQVKEQLPQWIGHHVLAYLAQPLPWVWRRRQLDPVTLVVLFVTQILNGNTAIHHLRHLAGMTCTATAYCQARMRLPLELVEYVGRQITTALAGESEAVCLWRDHRVWFADGSNFSMPDTPELQQHFGQPGQQEAGCGFPVATTLHLCNAAGFIVKTLALPLRTHEGSQIAKLHEQLQPGDVLVYDRAGCSYAQMALVSQKKLHAILRMHQKQIVDFRPHRKRAGQFPRGQRKAKPRSEWIRRLGPKDQIVKWFKPDQKPKWMSQEQYDALPDSLLVRELQYMVHRKGFRSRSITLATTLLEAEKYPAEELADRYFDRWSIELSFRDLKQTMGMEVLKCTKVEGVLKELAVFVLVYNLVRLVMLRASQRQHVPLDRISFIDALRWLRAPRDVGQLIDLIVNPRRPGRVEPRVIKRRMKPYPLMTRPRQELRQVLLNTGLAA